MSKQNKVYLDAEAWLNPTNDVVYVRVRQYLKNPDGSLCKRGFIFKTTSESMGMIPEACEYPYVNSDKLIKLDLEEE